MNPMPEHELFHRLTQSPKQKQAGADFLRELRPKTASAEQVANATSTFIKAHSREIAGAVLGAALAGGTQLVANKRKSDGGPSLQQASADAAVKRTKDAKDFSGRLSHAYAKSVKDVADVFADHPVKGAIMAMPIGAGAGLSVARMLKK